MSTNPAANLTDHDLYEAFQNKVGIGFVRRALAAWAGFDRYNDQQISRIIEAAFPEAAKAREERKKKAAAEAAAKQAQFEKELGVWYSAVNEANAVEAKMEEIRAERAAAEEAKLRAQAEKAVRG